MNGRNIAASQSNVLLHIKGRRKRGRPPKKWIDKYKRRH